MARDTTAPHDDDQVGPIEEQLKLHLERAHELGERAKRSNGAVQNEIERARKIASELADRVSSAYRRG